MNKLLVASLAAGTVSANLRDRAFYEAKFYDWVQEHRPNIKNGADFAHFLQNFANNDDMIETHNKMGKSYTLGHNQFSHMSYSEWVSYVRLGLGAPNKEPAPFTHSAPKDVSALPASVDWTTKTGIVTAVKDQGQCGSCWSFSATGAIEGAWFIAKNNLVSLSEQELMDCSKPEGNESCEGGLMDQAFEFVKKSGICTEDSYPYAAVDHNKCSSCSSVATISGYTDVAQSEDALAKAVTMQPVAVAIEADQSAFQFYSSGVMTGKCGTQLDHGVLAVGYGTLDGTEYWKVKNSWGTTWGMQGYILLQKGKSQTGGQCGILMAASYPTV